MTLEESRESTREVSLGALFAGPGLVEGESSLSVEDYSRIICRGGWPAPIARGDSAGGLASDYIDALCETDIAEASGEGIDPDKAHALIRSLSRNVSQEASNATILADVRDAGTGMSEPTLRKYVGALRRLFVVRELKAWAPTLRSRTPLRSSRTWHLCDPSLAAAALETSEEGLLNDLETMGYLFESLCVRDLRVYAHLLGGDVYHYRDKSGLEADAIVRLRDGRWAGFEVKLGGEKRIDEGARHLLALADRVDERRTGSPSFLAVVTGGRYAYTRADGVHVIPLGCMCAR
jgi:predicted AAA+ superfamily ATPase